MKGLVPPLHPLSSDSWPRDSQQGKEQDKRYGDCQFKEEHIQATLTASVFQLHYTLHLAVRLQVADILLLVRHYTEIAKHWI